MRNRRQMQKKLEGQRYEAAKEMKQLRDAHKSIPRKLVHFMRGIDFDTVSRKPPVGYVPKAT